MAEARQTLAVARQTLSTADKSLLELTTKAMQTLAIGTELLGKVLDGVTIELEVMGNPVPVKLKIKIDDDDDSDSDKDEKS
jgi:flagellar biosynthesis/type III secretory pathway ATPase